MKVRTLRTHTNEYGDSYVKQNGRKYELPDRDAKRLIRDGLVEEDKPQANEGSD